MDGSTILSLALLGTVVAAMTEGVRRSFPQSVFVLRLLPLLPLLLGALLAVLVPSLAPGESVGERSVYGVLAGAFSGQLYALVKRQVSSKVASVEPPAGGTNGR